MARRAVLGPFSLSGRFLVAMAVLAFAGVAALRIPALAYRIGLFAVFLALAALTHVAGDLPVHVDDAHRHFWPLSDWKFISPVSYWHPDHHGGIFSILESMLGVMLAIILFRSFKGLWVRIVLVLVCLAYIAVPLYFLLMFGG